MATPEAKRRRTANAAKRKQEAGLRQATFWLQPDAAARLDKLALQHGVSKEAIINRAILAYAMPAIAEGRRVVWVSPDGKNRRRGVLRRYGPFAEVDILFDDASDHGPDWRDPKEVEPE